jgi:hypothetical protein
MKVIDNKKDYYDYIVGTMGIDEKVVYDRRGSTIVGESDFYMFDYPHDYDLYFSKKPFKSDGKKIKKTIWQSCKYENRIGRRSWNWKKNGDLYEGMIYHLYLEVGYISYIFEVERYLDNDDALHVDVSIVDMKRLEKKDKKSAAPLYITPYNQLYTSWEDKVYCDSVDNPILKNTWIPRFISAQDMWNMLYEYISSLNDKEFTDSRTNEQHIESHGFDKKISFRHRK